MNRKAKSQRLHPLPPETTPEMKEEFDSFFKTLGFVPNSVLTMQRKPKLAKAFVQISERSGIRRARSIADSSVWSRMLQAERQMIPTAWRIPQAARSISG